MFVNSFTRTTRFRINQHLAKLHADGIRSITTAREVLYLVAVYLPEKY